jgi:hypothetical protein
VRFVGKDYEQMPPELPLAIAAMGNREVLTWALTVDKISADKLWLSRSVIAVSPLPEAETAAQGILKGTDPKAILQLLQGYSRSRSPQRLSRILECYSVRSKDPTLARATRDLLQQLAREGDDSAADALKKLFPAKPTGNDR